MGAGGKPFRRHRRVSRSGNSEWSDCGCSGSQNARRHVCGSEIGVKDQYRGEAPSVGVPEALYLGSVQECQQLPCECRSQTSAHICVRDVVRALGTAYAVAVMVYRLCSAYRAGGFPYSLSTVCPAVIPRVKSSSHSPKSAIQVTRNM